jgi:Rps23 Pro-64 3,4-dihydroxylase Tpa1-like proline 4-hydroxylase
MIKTTFSTYFLEKENLLDSSTLSALYNFVLITGQEETIVTPNVLPEVDTLRNAIISASSELASQYNFTQIEVSKRFSTHYYPPNKNCGMETHSDDLGDFGRKFIAFFYLEADPTSGGELELFDPRWLNAAWRDYASSVKIRPQTNKLVIFPTFLWHRVNPYFSKTFPRMALDAVIRVV